MCSDSSHRPADESGTGKPERVLVRPISMIALFGWALLAVPPRPAWGSPEQATAPPGATTPEAERKKPRDLIKPLAQQGRTAEAEVIAREMLSTAERDHGADSIEAAEAIDAIVRCMELQDKTQGDEAAELSRRAIQIKEKLLGPGDPEVAVTVNELANVYWRKGDYTAARPLYERALDIREKAPGVAPQIVAQSLHNLAALLADQGEYAAAKPLAERSVSVLEASGADHGEVANALNSQAMLLKRMGDYQGARRIYERALEIMSKKFGPDAPDGANIMANLGRLLILTGEYATARSLLDRALSDQEKMYGSDNRPVAGSLLALAETMIAAGDFSAARPYLERALHTRERLLGPNNPRLAYDLQLLAGTLVRSGDLAGAGPLYERALTIREQALGPRHPLVADSLNESARFQWASGKADEAFSLALRAEMVAREQFEETARGLSERDALRYEKIRASGLGIALSLLASTATGRSGSDRAGDVFEEVIRSRALVLDEMASRHRALHLEHEEPVATLAQELELARNRLARLVLRDPGADDAGKYLEQVNEAEADKERIETELAQRSAAFRSQKAEMHAGLADVRNALPAGSALVAYVQYGRLNPTLGVPVVPSYMAFVQDSGGHHPQAVPLGSADEIDSLVANWRREAGTDPRLKGHGADLSARYRESAAKLRAAVWDPLAGLIRGKSRIFIVPDGSLSLLTFGALPSGEVRYLVEEPNVIHYLSAERDLVRNSSPAAPGAGLLAVGDPDFGARLLPAHGSKAHAAGAAPAGAGAPKSTYRGSRAACGALRSLRFGSIPGSRAEARDVASLWRKGPAVDAGSGSGDTNVLSLIGAAADEATVKRSATGRRVVHLATHGFFSEEVCESSVTSALRGAGASWGAGDEIGPILGDNPLLLSGLSLAGANRRDEVGPDVDAEDGVLTAVEIASLDLTGVEWVVLSGCETGVGRTRAGEGVLGMRRAFEIAGAGTLIMSLWSVEDEATRAWMRSLYEARLASRSTADAVRDATLRILREQRRRGRTTHPFFWGGFVAAGDWR